MRWIAGCEQFGGPSPTRPCLGTVACSSQRLAELVPPSSGRGPATQCFDEQTTTLLANDLPAANRAIEGQVDSDGNERRRHALPYAPRTRGVRCDDPPPPASYNTPEASPFSPQIRWVYPYGKPELQPYNRTRDWRASTQMTATCQDSIPRCCSSGATHAFRAGCWVTGP